MFLTFSITKFFFFFSLSQTIIFKFHFPCFPPKKMLLIYSVFSCEPFTATKINKIIKLKKKRKRKKKYSNLSLYFVIDIWVFLLWSPILVYMGCNLFIYLNLVLCRWEFNVKDLIQYFNYMLSIPISLSRTF